MNAISIKSSPGPSERIAHSVTSSKSAMSHMWEDGRAKVGRYLKRNAERR